MRNHKYNKNKTFVKALKTSFWSIFLFVFIILILFFCKFDFAEFPLMVQFYTNMY